MCGIVGYVGSGEASEFLIDGLRRLEYRGYDSAGIAVYENGKIQIEKKKGGLANLEAVLKEHPLHGHIGIGHTRWATHGKPSDVNAHPHGDCHNHFVIVHNGIIENYMTLKKELIEKGHVFKSETDTEVVAHLAEELDDGNFLSTVRKVLAKIEGSYSLVFMDDSDPDTIICTKKDNPLIIGLGKGENFIASDIPAVINRTRQIYIMNDYELAVVKKDSITFYDHDDKEITKEIHEVTWSAEAAEKGGYPHFMLKEIYEQPKAIHDTVQIYLNKDGSVNFKDLGWTEDCFDGRMFRRIIRIGLPAGLQSVMYTSSNILIQSSVNALGTDTVAAWTAYSKIDSLFWMIVNAFGISITTFVGQNYGAGKMDRVHKGVRTCMGITAGATVLLSVILYNYASICYQLFTTDAQVVVIGEQILHFLVPTYFTYIAIEILSGTLRGIGDSWLPMIICCLGICALRVVWILTAVPLKNDILTIVFSYPLTWTVTSIAFIVYYLFFSRLKIVGRKR